jgi:arylsulfatase
MGHDHFRAEAPAALGEGRHTVVVEFAYDGGFGGGGHAVLRVDDVDVADARIERTVPLVFSMSGETFDVGIDTGAPVGPYPHGFACTAHIHGVTLERLSEPPPHIAARIAAGELAAGLAAH